MIPKMTSHELNEVLNSANDKLDSVIADVKNIKNDISKKLKIMRYESEYMEQQMLHLSTKKEETQKPNDISSTHKVFVLPEKSLSKQYEQYGCTITPKFKKTPVNVFNIITTATGEAFYRDIAEVAINGIVKEEYKNILKHDHLSSKELFFEELEGEDPSLNITITLDTANTLGSVLFNMIELDTFLNGAYNIEYIRIYAQDNSYEEYSAIEYAGKMRITLPKAMSLHKVEFQITPTFHTQVDGIDRYPVGIKHIYFYNTIFTSDSYAIAVIESDQFINTIKDKVLIKTPNQIIETTAANKDIQFFLKCTIDKTSGLPVLSSPQEPSKANDTKEISMNVKKIYAKIPLKDEAVLGYTFEITSKIY